MIGWNAIPLLKKKTTQVYVKIGKDPQVTLSEKSKLRSCV